MLVPMAKRTKAKSPYHHGNLREALISSAEQLLEEKGVHGMSLRGVARLAGVSQAAPYHHFKDKEALLVEVAELGFQRLRTFMSDGAAHAEEPAERLRGLGQGYVRFAMAHPATFRMMFGSIVENKTEYQTFQSSGVSWLALVLDVLGAIPFAERFDAAVAVWAGMHGVAGLLVDGVCERDRFAQMGITPESMVDTAMEGLVRAWLP
jgi:AcrR family transcriptional regulator